LPDLQSDETFVFDMAIAGDVPPGSGLSSSASLEVATAAFLEYIMETKKAGMAYSSYMGEMTKDVMAKERAVRCQRAENVFCNVPCGIMDQFVSSAGSKGNLLLIDCRSLEVRKVSPPEEAANNNRPVLVIANSNVKHDLGAGEYPIRVQQCKEATEALSSVNPLIKSLRDASMDDIDAATLSGKLSGVLLKRAKHVVSENARTVEAADAWEKGDWEVVGRLMNESHSSMKDDYETSCEEIDILQELAKNFDGVYGSRLTGGGFGGCTVTLVKKNKARELMYHLRREYKEKYDIIPSIFETTPGDGASAIIM
jgi:galactokinase